VLTQPYFWPGSARAKNVKLIKTLKVLLVHGGCIGLIAVPKFSKNNIFSNFDLLWKI